MSFRNFKFNLSSKLAKNGSFPCYFDVGGAMSLVFNITLLVLHWTQLAKIMLGIDNLYHYFWCAWPFGILDMKINPHVSQMNLCAAVGDYHDGILWGEKTHQSHGTKPYLWSFTEWVEKSWSEVKIRHVASWL